MKGKMEERSMSVREVAFLAEQETIYILPRYSMNGVELIGRNMKRLRALQKTEVPLWLAVLLKKQKKCNIVIPDWLSVVHLKGKYGEEQRVKERVSSLPWHWIPISKILLDVCPDDFVDSPHELRSIIQDLREIRLLKTRQGFAMIDDEDLELTGLSLMEINEIRPFLLKTMDTLRDLRRVTLSDDEPEEGDADGREAEDGVQQQGLFPPGLDPEPHADADDADPHLASSRVLDDSHLNTSGLDATLVDTTALGPTTKRRRVDRRSAVDNPSDSDSDVEYRR